jgi:2-dehydropantoate 2-reductase
MAMRIAVIGPGAVGGTVAAWLAQNPALDIEVCVRTAFDRLEVETPGGPLTAAPRVLTSPDQAGPVDWAIVATKTYDVAATGAWLARLVGPETRVAVLQNGVEHVERFTPYADPARITPAVVDIPAERSGPGRIRQQRDGTILVPAGAAGEAFAGLFAHTSIGAATTDDFTTAAWRKLAVNCTGAVNALTLKPSGVARREPIAAIIRTLVGECVAVGRAQGADLPDDLGETVVARYRAEPGDRINSLHADRVAGRPMELDARNGVIVRLGDRHGIATPVNAMMVALLEAATS